MTDKSKQDAPLPKTTHDLINFIEDVTGTELNPSQKAMVQLGTTDPVFDSKNIKDIKAKKTPVKRAIKHPVKRRVKKAPTNKKES